MKIKRKSRAVEDIPLSSTADIAFLLIVFFLAASALLEFRGLKLPIPKLDAPPMQLLKKDIFRIFIAANGEYMHEDAALALDDLQLKMRESFGANSEMVLVVRVDPEAPSETVPRLIQRIQQERIKRLSLAMEEKGGKKRGRKR